MLRANIYTVNKYDVIVVVFSSYCCTDDDIEK